MRFLDTGEKKMFWLKLLCFNNYFLHSSYLFKKCLLFCINSMLACTVQSKASSPSILLKGKAPLCGGYAVRCAGAIQGKEGGIQMLAGLAPSSQTVGSNIRVIHEQAKCSSWKTEVNIVPATLKLGELVEASSHRTNVICANVASR